MRRRPSFNRVLDVVAARQLYNGGASLREIADAMHISRTTVRRWLRVSGYAAPIRERRRALGSEDC